MSTYTILGLIVVIIRTYTISMVIYKRNEKKTFRDFCFIVFSVLWFVLVIISIIAE